MQYIHEIETIPFFRRHFQSVARDATGGNNTLGLGLASRLAHTHNNYVSDCIPTARARIP